MPEHRTGLVSVDSALAGRVSSQFGYWYFYFAPRGRRAG